VQSDVLNPRFTNQGTIRINGGDFKDTGYFRIEGTVNFNWMRAATARSTTPARSASPAAAA
jgi:hypothetical protein